MKKILLTFTGFHDLYYRLSIGEVKLPSLRERRSDIPKLVLYILYRLNGSLKRQCRLTADALSRLQAHNWEGNIRDLENVIERSVRLSRVDVLDGSELLITEPITYTDPLDALPEPYEGFSLDEFLGSARKQMILRALEAAKGRKRRMLCQCLSMGNRLNSVPLTKWIGDDWSAKYLSEAETLLSLSPSIENCMKLKPIN